MLELKQVTKITYIFIFILGLHSSATAAPRLNLTDSSSKKEGKTIKQKTIALVEKPEKIANDFLDTLRGLPEFGWEYRFLTEFKVLDLVAYLWSLEEAQFYASQGEWAPPAHIRQQEYINFYKTKINPEARLYSYGILKDPLYRFSSTFLEGVLTLPPPKRFSLLSILLNSDREFWQFTYTQYIVPSVDASTELINSLMPSIRQSTLAVLFKAILHARLQNDAEVLIRSFLSNAVMAGEISYTLALKDQNRLVSLMPTGLNNKGDSECESLLSSVMSEFKKFK